MISADHASTIAGIPLKTILTDHRALIDSYSEFFELYRPDGLILFLDVTLEAEAAGVELHFPDDAPPLSEKFLGFGEIPDVDPEKHGRIPLCLKTLTALVKNWGDTCPVFCSLKDPFSLAANVVGPEEMLVATIESPDAAEKTITQAVKNQLRFIDAIIDQGGIPFIGAPLASGSLISPSTFRRFVERPLVQLMEHIHDQSEISALHICGRIAPLLPVLSELPLDLLSVEGINRSDAEKHLAETVIMGVAGTDVLQMGSPNDCRDEAIRSRQTLPNPCILSTGCDVPQKASIENVSAFIDQARRVAADR